MNQTRRTFDSSFKLQIAYPLLTQPRNIAREKIRKYGHPKKLK
jgi:hypothetical protein